MYTSLYANGNIFIESGVLEIKFLIVSLKKQESREGDSHLSSNFTKKKLFLNLNGIPVSLKTKDNFQYNYISFNSAGNHISKCIYIFIQTIYLSIFIHLYKPYDILVYLNIYTNHISMCIV